MARGGADDPQGFLEMAGIVIGDPGFDFTGFRRGPASLTPTCLTKKSVISTVFSPSPGSGLLIGIQIPGHDRPDFFNRGRAGGAGGDQNINGLTCQTVQIMDDQLVKGLPIAGRQGRYPTATLPFGQKNIHLEMIQALQYRLADLRINLVDEAPIKKSRLDP